VGHHIISIASKPTTVNNNVVMFSTFLLKIYFLNFETNGKNPLQEETMFSTLTSNNDPL
jgi:hypothetical protein